MNRFAKLGYIMLGAGLGMFAATLMYEKEMRKPIGDIEEYVPAEDRENDGNDSEVDAKKDSDNKASRAEVASEFANSDTHILDYYKSDSDDSIGVKNLENRAKKRREEFEKARSEGKSQLTRYSKMYKGSSNEVDEERERRIEEMLQAQHDANVDFNRRMDQRTEEARKRNADYMAYITQEGNMPDDIPNDDEPYENYVEDVDGELVRERVENNIEIYLGENPQDFSSLIFYDGDNTLTDDQDHVVPAADEVVGLVALSRLIEGGPGAENGVIYVRNLRTMNNYEITLDSGSYAETVLGIFDSHQNKGAGGDVNRR